jgi:hypothetical protein
VNKKKNKIKSRMTGKIRKSARKGKEDEVRIGRKKERKKK